MKHALLFALVFILSGAASAQIEFKGNSGKLMYMELSQRSNTQHWNAANLLGHSVDLVGYRDLIQCKVKAGKKGLEDNYVCALPGTDPKDIVSSYVANEPYDDVADNISNFQNENFLQSPLVIVGMSAARLYKALTHQTQDPTFIRQQGQTQTHHHSVEVVAINEMFCQVIHRAVFDVEYTCLLGNVAMPDSNAPLTVPDLDPVFDQACYTVANPNSIKD